jgi:hypothetical protein
MRQFKLPALAGLLMIALVGAASACPPMTYSYGAAFSYPTQSFAPLQYQAAQQYVPQMVPQAAPACASCEQAGGGEVPFNAPQAPMTYAAPAPALAPVQSYSYAAPALAPVFVPQRSYSYGYARAGVAFAPSCVPVRTFTPVRTYAVQRSFVPVRSFVQARTFVPVRTFVPARSFVPSYSAVGFAVNNGPAVVSQVRRGGLFPSIGRALFGQRQTTVTDPGSGASFTVRGRTNVRVR